VDEDDPESLRLAEEMLAQEKDSIILAVLPVNHVFDNPLPIILAKKVRASSQSVFLLSMHRRPD